MNDFPLAFQQYDYDVTLDALELFKSKSDGGKEMDFYFLLFSRIQTKAAAEGLTIDDCCELVCREISRSDAAVLFYSLAKQCRPDLMLDEMRDAVFRTCNRPVGTDDQYQPWPLVLMVIASRYYSGFLNSHNKPKKKELDT